MPLSDEQQCLVYRHGLPGLLRIIAGEPHMSESWLLTLAATRIEDLEATVSEASSRVESLDAKCRELMSEWQQNLKTLQGRSP